MVDRRIHPLRCECDTCHAARLGMDRATFRFWRGLFEGAVIALVLWLFPLRWIVPALWHALTR